MVYKTLSIPRSYDMGVVAAISAVASTGYSIVQGQNQKRQQEKALNEQRVANQKAAADAKTEKERAEQEYNKANRQTANVNAINEESTLMANQGAGGTLLTGNQGVDPTQLNLGKNTLLGG